MNEAFLKAYERELALLYDRGKEFAEDYPGIASRLGGLLQGNLDPAVDGLLQGSAFLAARVQLQIEREFSTFTHEMLDQLLPNFLTPTPSTMIVRLNPNYAGPEIPEGRTIAAGEYMDARYVEQEQRIQCRYRLSAPLEIWPLRITDASYFGGPGRFQALGITEPHPDTSGGLTVTLERPGPGGKGTAPMNALALDEVNIHLTGDFSDAAGLYEAIFAQTLRASVRIEDAHGDPIIVPLSASQIEPVGFTDDEAFFVEDSQIFRGFTLIREFFMNSRKFLGFRLTGLGDIIRANAAGSMQLLFELDTINDSLAPRVGTDDFSLFCVPAVNLFEETANQIPLDVRKEEYHVTPSSSPSENYEVHRINSVHANFGNDATQTTVYPLYGAPPLGSDPEQSLYYTHRQRDIRLSAREKRSSRRREYRGVETLISIYEPSGLDDEDKPTRLHLRTLCSNRHLPQFLPIGQSGADFFLTEDTSLDLACISGPTPPKPSLLDAQVGKKDGQKIPWQLISLISLNFLGLDNRSPGGGIRGLQEMLRIFVDLDSPMNLQQISGISDLTTRPIVRSIQTGNRYHSARGIEVTLTFDERAFEAGNVVLFSALLDHFFAEYAPVNSFTQLVAVSKQRGHLKTWTPRSGRGPLL